MLNIPNGFKPDLSDDGQTCACGFNEVLSVSLPDGAVTRLDFGGQASAAGFHNGQIVGSKYLLNGRDLIGGPIQVDPTQLPGVNPTRAVARGYVVSSAGGQHFINGKPVGYDAGQSDIETFDGQHYGYKPHNVDPVVWPFFVHDVATLNLQIWIGASVSNAVVWTDQNGRPWVFCNLPGHAAIYNSDGLIYQFPQGEFRGALSNGPDGPWAWTCGQFTDGSPFICGRPFSAISGPAIILRGMWWAGMDVKWKPAESRWVVAGYYDGPGGTLYIEPNVDPAQPREVLDFGNSQPGGPTNPPPSGDTTITVTVRAGETKTIVITGLETL